MEPIHIIVTIIYALVLIAFLPWWVDLVWGLFELFKDLATTVIEGAQSLIEDWLIMWEAFIHNLNRGDD